MNWVDCVIILILIFGAVSGASKGLVLTVIRVGGLIFSLIISKAYYLEFSKYLIINTPIEDKIIAFIEHKNISDSLWYLGEKIGSELLNNVTIAIINLISLISLFILCKIAFSILELILSGICELPGLKEVNKLGGLIVGVCGSVIVLLIAFSILMPMMSCGLIKGFEHSLSQSSLAKYFYSYNFILNWIFDSTTNYLLKKSVQF